MKKISRLLLIETLVLALPITKTMSQDTTSYMSPYTSVAKGKAPGMTYKLLSDNKGTKEYVIIFAKNDEILSGISDFAAQRHIVSARFTAIGALKETTMAWFDLSRKSYKLNLIHQQVELASLIGDIALYDGNPVVHIHCSVGFPDGSIQGGHLVEAVTYPTVELFMTIFPTALKKELDKETDLKLIHPEIQ
jgi:predicted DNA-binding protein with PD1-like motif